jgi:putative FmdB family regulatory protein
MPITNYKCEGCGNEFAKIILDLKQVPKTCPVCGAESPLEVGPAFTPDLAQMNRALCGSCDSCAEEPGCETPPPSS